MFLDELKNKIKKIDLEKNKKQLILICILFLLVVTYLYFAFFLRSNFGTFFSQIKEIRSVKTNIVSTKRDAGHEDILLKRLNSVESRITDYEKKLPAEQEIPMLIESVSEMARGSYVKILGIRPVDSKNDKKSKSKKVYQEIPILISAKSGYHQLGVFINKLEGADRFMELSEIKINSNKATPRVHDVELIISTYVLLKDESKKI